VFTGEKLGHQLLLELEGFPVPSQWRQIIIAVTVNGRAMALTAEFPLSIRTYSFVVVACMVDGSIRKSGTPHCCFFVACNRNSRV
jgi:hypothetical protein